MGIVLVTRGKQGSLVYCNSRLRPTLPASWENCYVATPAISLAKGTIINSNGAGDAFTAGFLLATMLRHTGLTVPENKEVGNSAPSPPPVSLTKTPTKKQLTPYALYMQENYLTLKAQLHGDKKAIFSRCHELWENESPEVKMLYERRASEENSDAAGNDEVVSPSSSQNLNDSIETAGLVSPRNLYMTNRSLNLESAANLAALIAARHIDVSTRDDMHLDLNALLEQCMVYPDGLEEI